MNYSQAKDLKKKLISKGITIDGMEDYQVLITPGAHNDFIKFINDYRAMDLQDEDAKSYSLDNSFDIYALWTNGTEVLHKKIS